MVGQDSFQNPGDQDLSSVPLSFPTQRQFPPTFCISSESPDPPLQDHRRLTGQASLPKAVGSDGASLADSGEGHSAWS